MSSILGLGEKPYNKNIEVEEIDGTIYDKKSPFHPGAVVQPEVESPRVPILQYKREKKPGFNGRP